MIRYIIKRLLQMIPVLLGVMIIVFTLSYLMPGDPVLNQMPDNYTQEQYDEVQHELGLDQPYIVRLGQYIWGVVTRFDLGTSYMTNRAVTASIAERLWITVRLGVLGVCLSVVLGIPFGVISAIKQKSAVDYTITILAVFLASIPGFWLALEGIVIFSIKLGILPASGLSTPLHYVLPVLASGMQSLAGITRMTRSSMLEVIRQDYIRTARAKGLREMTIVRKHALKNALIPVITMVGGQVSMIIGGNVIIETIFNIPGLGSLMVTGINNRDYPTIMGITLVIAIFVCCMNLLVDLAYAAIDPRIKAKFSGGAKRRKKSVKTEEAKA
jgi:peptide/nickel transport system permease protein